MLILLLVIVLALIVLALARQVGILHERVAPAGALQPMEGPKVGELTEAMQLKDRLVFMDFLTDKSENVYPMIPAGGGQNEMILI